MVSRARAEPAYGAMLALVLLGVVLRARGYLFERHGLWVDEASWAVMLMRDPLETLLIRPVGYMYWFIWRNLDAHEASFWGKKYGVFYQPSRRQSFASWWLGRYVELTQFPGLRRRYWDAGWVAVKELTALRSVDRWLWLFLHGLGVLRLLGARRFRMLALLGLPILTTSVMNYLGHWPFGAFRTNLFMVGYMAAFAGMALDAPRGRTSRWPALVPAVVLVVLPLVLFDRWWNARKKSLGYDTDMPLVFAALTRLEPPPARGRVMLFLSRRSCDTYEYYATTHPATSKQCGEALRRTFSVRCFSSLPELATGMLELTPEEGHAWLLTDMGMSDIKELRSAIPAVEAPSRFYAPPTRLLEVTRR